MYFDNITNPELQYFHGFKVPNFSISLTQIFSSDLFKVEPVTTDNVYRIYPLFYTDKIVSSNSLDKILENKCIICKKNEKETYLSFISNENAEIVDFINYGSYYDIGDSLTTAQYNSIVQLYRANTVNFDKFNIKQGIVNGTYADYDFNIDSTTIIDTGILVTDETLVNLGTVTLTNPVFNNSEYVLKLKVYHMTDINITDEVNQDNIVVDTLTITLEKDIAKNIPFETLDYDYVIGFEAEVEITHTNPVINGVWIDELILTSDVNVIELGESVDLTATLFDNTGTSVAGETVTFYDGNTVIGTDVTDNDGVANYTYTPASIGDISLTAVTNGLTSNPVVITVEHELILTNLSIDVPLVLIYSDEFQITGILTDENNNVLTGASVDLYVGNTKVDTQTTDNTGKAEFTQTPVATGNHSFQLKYSGDADYYSCVSSVVSRTVGKETSVLNITSPLDSSQWYTDTGITVDGSLTTDDGEPISNATVNVRIGQSILATPTTDSNGAFSTVLSQFSGGVYTLQFQYPTNSLYTESVVQKQNINVSNPSLSLTGDKSILSYADGDSCILTATLHSAVPTGQVVELYYGAVKLGEADDEGDGTYTFEYESQGIGDIEISAKCGSLVSEIYRIEDLLKYDSGASDNTSKYDTTYSNSQTFSYDTTENAYKIQRTSSGFGSVLVDGLTAPNNVKISYLLKIDSSTSLNTQPSIAFFNENGSGVCARSGYNGSTRYFILSDTSYSDYGSTIARDDYSSLSQNTWYRVELSHNSGSLTAKLYDSSDNLLKTVTGSTSKFANNSNKVGVMCTNSNGVTIHFKELKVKPL